jgi:hypothetical protein
LPSLDSCYFQRFRRSDSFRPSKINLMMEHE